MGLSISIYYRYARYAETAITAGDFLRSNGQVGTCFSLGAFLCRPSGVLGILPSAFFAYVQGTYTYAAANKGMYLASRLKHPFSRVETVGSAERTVL